MDRYYRRHLPHWQPDGKVFFVTFRLYGSLPKRVIDRIREDARRIRNEKACPGETPTQKEHRDAKRILAIYDKALDETARLTGTQSPCWLKDERVARIMQDAIHHRDGNQYGLHRYAVMPNHVHLLIKPLLEETQKNPSGQHQEEDERVYRSLKRIIGGLKLYTARQSNRILNRSGAFWQQESFDHWARTDEEYYRIIRYIDRNPVVAGLCAEPANWPWSSAGEN